MKELPEENRIVPMNDEIYDSMFLEELEERLETDPLLPGGLVSLIGGDVDMLNNCECNDGQLVECDCHQGMKITCPCRGGVYYS